MLSLEVMVTSIVELCIFGLSTIQPRCAKIVVARIGRSWRHLADDLTDGVPVLNLTRLVKRRVSTAVAGGETKRLKAEKHCEQQHCQVSLACLLTGKARRE